MYFLILKIKYFEIVFTNSCLFFLKPLSYQSRELLKSASHSHDEDRELKIPETAVKTKTIFWKKWCIEHIKVKLTRLTD